MAAHGPGNGRYYATLICVTIVVCAVIGALGGHH